MKLVILVYMPNETDLYCKWGEMALDGITFKAAQALARKLYGNHGHNVLLVALLTNGGRDYIPFGPIAEEWLKNPPPRPPVEIRRSKLSPELFDPVRDESRRGRGGGV